MSDTSTTTAEPARREGRPQRDGARRSATGARSTSCASGTATSGTRRPRATGCSPATTTSARRSRRPRCSATTRSCRRTRTRSTGSCPSFTRSADPHEVPPADEPVVLAAARWPSSSRACASWPGPRSRPSSPTAAATTWRRSPTASRSPAFLASMGLPMDDADFFVSVAHRMSGAVGGEPEAVAQMNAAWGELAAYWTDMLADRRANPLDPSVDFVTMMSKAPARRRADARHRHHRHHGHADARQPGHAEEPARLADVAPRPPTPRTGPGSSPSRR